MGDESWRRQPKRISIETQSSIVRELGALMRAQSRAFSVVLHGGEPLLLGSLRLDSLLGQLTGELGPRCGVGIQTNGVLITNEILDVCARYGVTLSVSLDGPREIHDKFRVDLHQRPTHSKVIAGITTLQAHTHASQLFSGLLAVVDPDSDPDSVYDYFKALAVPSVDFLYRDGNHTTLPYGKVAPSSVEYGHWMSRILDRYVTDPAPFRIRMLDDMMKLLLGGQGVKEGVGLTDYGILVIDTDGSIKKNDTLKSSTLGDQFESAWTIGTNSLSAICASAEFRTYHEAQRPTSSQCRFCPLLKVCGGGMLTHRYKRETKYDNPTVFCADQMLLISRMETYLSPFNKGSAP
jgi:uncharacterized protein